MAVAGLKTIDYEERAKVSEHKKKLYKVMTEKEAVQTFLHDGDSFCFGGFVMWRQAESVMREMVFSANKKVPAYGIQKGDHPVVVNWPAPITSFLSSSSSL